LLLEVGEMCLNENAGSENVGPKMQWWKNRTGNNTGVENE